MNKHSFTKTRTHVAVRNMIAAGLFAAAVMPVQAADFELGDFDLSVNSTVSVGTAFRTQGPDGKLIANSNVTEDGIRGRAPSSTTDDGNLNYNKGDTYTTIIKGLHDFELKKDNYGFFGRVKWFYDHTLNNDEVFHGHSPNGYVRNSKLQDSGFHPYSRFDGIDVLDAFGYVNTEIGGMPLDVRLGRQVISWGESTLIFSPISGLNTLDLSALRRPGVDLKEAFTPAENLYFNLGVTDNTSLEAFYQLRWRKTVTEGCGTFFASNDIIGDGCNLVTIGSVGSDQTGFNAVAASGNGGVQRALDDQPDDGGQYGFALRHYASSLDTEFGAYYLNYHSRLPIISAVKQTDPANPFTGRYIAEYPEDIAILGTSFATNVGGWAWSGELSYAMDVPIQINTADLLLSVLSPAYGGGSYFGQRYNAAGAGQKVSGFDQFDVTQIQSTLIKTFDRALGSSQVVFLGEVGATFVSGLPEANGQAGAAGIPGARYGRSPVFGSASGVGLSAPDGQTAAGFVTDFAWGYRLRTAATYRDVMFGTDFIPSISWSHDVDGWSPEPGQAFNEGRQSIALGLGLEFDANTKASVSYVKFVDSAEFDVFRDRDFISFTGSYSF